MLSTRIPQRRMEVTRRIKAGSQFHTTDRVGQLRKDGAACIDVVCVADRVAGVVVERRRVGELHEGVGSRDHDKLAITGALAKAFVNPRTGEMRRKGAREAISRETWSEDVSVETWDRCSCGMGEDWIYLHGY